MTRARADKFQRMWRQGPECEGGGDDTVTLPDVATSLIRLLANKVLLLTSKRQDDVK